MSIPVDLRSKYCSGKANTKKKMIMKFGSGKKHILRLRSFERCKN